MNPFMVSVMEKSQTSDSFQRELEDFIRKQRARGLHPRVCFRKMAEECIHQERYRVSPQTPMLGPQLWFRKHRQSSTSDERLTENQVPHRRRRLDSLNHQRNQPANQDRKERRYQEERGRAISEEPGMPKRKHHRESGSRREDRSLRRKASTEPAGTEKSTHRKESRHGGREPTKGRRRVHREKKGPEERDLWDEAILGSCY